MERVGVQRKMLRAKVKVATSALISALSVTLNAVWEEPQGILPFTPNGGKWGHRNSEGKEARGMEFCVLSLPITTWFDQVVEVLFGQKEIWQLRPSRSLASTCLFRVQQWLWCVLYMVFISCVEHVWVNSWSAPTVAPLCRRQLIQGMYFRLSHLGYYVLSSLYLIWITGNTKKWLKNFPVLGIV